MIEIKKIKPETVNIRAKDSCARNKDKKILRRDNIAKAKNHFLPSFNSSFVKCLRKNPVGIPKNAITISKIV